ncbi:MAG: hypothetical protein U0807_18440 [Candidatus Binatia bacterium]
MKRRRAIALVAALAILIGVRTAVCAPLESTAALRAVGCCAAHCKHVPTAGAAARCCQVSQQALDQARVPPAAPSFGSPDLVAVPLDAAIPPLVPARGSIEVAARAYRAGPVFLLTRALRL